MKLFTIKKFIKAKNIKEATKLDKKTPIHHYIVDEDKKNK